MFLHLVVILFPGGVSSPVHAGIHRPGQRQTPNQTRGRHPPPGADTPPPFAVHAGRYGQHSGGTHPTGMHTCSPLILIPFQLDADTLGKNAKTVYRDDTGRRRNLKAEAAKDAEAARKKGAGAGCTESEVRPMGKGVRCLKIFIMNCMTYFWC